MICRTDQLGDNSYQKYIMKPYKNYIMKLLQVFGFSMSDTRLTVYKTSLYKKVKRHDESTYIHYTHIQKHSLHEAQATEYRRAVCALLNERK